jgi:TAP-like protein
VVDYTKPEGEKIKIVVSRVRHTLPDPQYQGVMLVNPGGPGGSGLILSIFRAFVRKGGGAAYDLVRLLERYHSVYGLGSTQAAVRRLFYQTQERLYRQPAQGQLGRTGGSEWNDAFLYAGYAQSLWPELGEVFRAYARRGEVGPLDAAYVGFSGYGDDNGYAVYLGVICTDNRWPQSWAKWKRDNNRIYRRAPYLTWGNAWYNEPCRHWPAKAQRPVKIKDRGIEGMLLINETLDAATPYGGALAVRPGSATRG